MAKEKNLTTVTSVAAADFARLVTSAGASVKATAANLAKYIIETYNGSTVAGSAQTVKSALDSLNSKFTLYNDTEANDASALCLAKFNLVVSKGEGSYFINGGWKSRSFGFSVVSVLNTSPARGFVVFVGQDMIYHAYINDGAVALIYKVTETAI